MPFLHDTGYAEPTRKLIEKVPGFVANDTKLYNVELKQRQNLTLSRGSFVSFFPVLPRNKTKHTNTINKLCTKVGNASKYRPTYFNYLV